VVVVLLFLGVLGFLAGGLFQHPIFAVQLFLEDPPATLPVPVDRIKSHDLRDTWGAPRSGGRRHQGIDIFAPRGTPVRSATRGLVWRVGQNRLGGNVVWVLGPGGELHYYAHLDRVAGIAAGDIVERGGLLGYVGNTGNARNTPYHLHYGIYTLSHGAINPFPRLAPAS
jgi:murein DD-endopeptidase MepM/ murein hydrolase activator NlpD